MADNKLTKPEMDFLHPAIVLKLKIEVLSWRKTPCWDGDYMMPVKVGKMCESLIKRGYLIRNETGTFGGATIYSSKKSDALICRECHGNGKLFDDNDREIGTCPNCYRGITGGRQ